MDLAPAAVKDETTIEGHRRQRDPRRRHLLPVRLQALDVRPEGGALGLVPTRLDLGAEVGDLPRQALQRLLEPRQAERLQPLARLDRRDHLDAGSERLGVRLVPHRVVAVEVAIDHVPDGQLGDLLADLADQGLCGRWLRVGVDHQHVVAVHHDRGVAVQQGRWPGDRGVDALGDPLQVEQPGRRGAGREGMGAVGERSDGPARGDAARREQPRRRPSTQELTPGRSRGDLGTARGSPW